MKLASSLAVAAALVLGANAFANDAKKTAAPGKKAHAAKVECKHADGKSTWVKSDEECTKAGGTVVAAAKKTDEEKTGETK